MGYTHYLRRRDTVQGITETQKEIVNEFYRKALSLIIDDESGYDLFKLSKLSLIEETFQDEFNKCFHEYGWTDDDFIAVINNRNEDFIFCKTAGKAYDIAVVLSYVMLSYTKLYEFTSDGDVSMFDLSTDEELAVSIKEYIDANIEDHGYDIEELVNLFYIYTGHLQEPDHWSIDKYLLSRTTEPAKSADPVEDGGFKVGDRVKTFDGITTTILRKESNGNFKLKGVRKYYHYTMLSDPTVKSEPANNSTDKKFYSLSTLSREEKHYIADQIMLGSCQINIPDTNYIIEINLISNT